MSAAPELRTKDRLHWKSERLCRDGRGTQETVSLEQQCGRQDDEGKRDKKGNTRVEPQELATAGVVYRKEERGGRCWTVNMEAHWFGSRSCGLGIHVGVSNQMAGK